MWLGDMNTMKKNRKKTYQSVEYIVYHVPSLVQGPQSYCQFCWVQRHSCFPSERPRCPSQTCNCEHNKEVGFLIWKTCNCHSPLIVINYLCTCSFKLDQDQYLVYSYDMRPIIVQQMYWDWKQKFTSPYAISSNFRRFTPPPQLRLTYYQCKPDNPHTMAPHWKESQEWWTPKWRSWTEQGSTSSSMFWNSNSRMLSFVGRNPRYIDEDIHMSI